MGKTSKDLLHLERKSYSSNIESPLLVCRKDSKSQPHKSNPDKKPMIDPVPKSNVLGKVKDFLGLISEANPRLQLDAKDNSKDCNIEVLTGNESEVIEMDLMLGIADLHTPEAVAAAESAMAGYQPAISLDASSSDMESEDTNDEDDDNDDNDHENDNKHVSGSLKRSKSEFDKHSSKSEGKNQSLKRPKIIELL